MGWRGYTVVVAGILSATQSVAQAPAPDLRVLVFPHLLKYAEPQGRETQFKTVTLESKGTCVATTQAGQVAARGSSLTFKWETLPAPLQVSCTAPVTLVREKKLPSFTYSGSFLVQRSQAATSPAQVQVINELPLDQYLAGVLPAEMAEDWPLETLKAQAVAARTYALWEWKQARRPGLGYDFDDTVQYQAYSGIPSFPIPAATRALEETSGIVLTTADGKPIRAYFHSDSGGHTEDAANAIPEVVAPYCMGKPEVYDLSKAPPPWEKRMSLTEAQAALQGAGMLPAGAALEDAEVDEATRYPSGRAKTVVLSEASGAKTPVLAIDLRFALGLKSTLFHLHKEGADLVFEGRGTGHGVGMSQWGAKLLNDELHWEFSKILLFYYTDVKLCEHCSL
jgi:stage II sporulation protein D